MRTGSTVYRPLLQVLYMQKDLQQVQVGDQALQALVEGQERLLGVLGTQQAL